MFCFSLGDMAAGRLLMLRLVDSIPMYMEAAPIEFTELLFFNMRGRWEEDVLRRDPGEFGKGVRDGFDQDTLYTYMTVKE